ncbi:ATP synthase gamma chain [Roseovarius litorisediminis]|uniref:ATP synthase gamma chain n=1 Tax=Roseovarius litorisediminis TaxID=1312363 RepID=A0A1Y5S3Z9_9RHOB|nr:FoF1 ATP synthase subunit gamma [Roseovarius litorisediminis]SLN31148.1 ATP synthase gamma chain [Roseovarius litorisediminis]
MTQTLEKLARQTSSLKGIRSVVHTMKTLSVINASPYEQAAQAIELYHETVLDGLHSFLTAFGPIEDTSRHKAGNVLIIFGSDHGLCGNYNEVLARHAAAQIDGSTASPVRVLCVGAQMADALADQHIRIDQTLFPAASVDGIGRLANLLIQRLEDIRSEDPAREMAVSLAYVTQDGAKGQRPVVTSLLPIDQALLTRLQAKPWTSRSRPFFSMPPGDLFLTLVRSHLFATLFRAIAEALMTENAARLALMQQAEKSVDDRLETLLQQTRAVRQDEITTELLDVIIGFEALRKGRAKKARQPSQETGADRVPPHAI